MFAASNWMATIDNVLAASVVEVVAMVLYV